MRLFIPPRNLGVCIPVYRGALGFLPLRKPVHLVMGAPMDFSCKQPGSPTDEEVRSAHSCYMEALILGAQRLAVSRPLGDKGLLRKKLYDEEKHRYGHPERELTID